MDHNDVFDVEAVRARFPALARIDDSGRPAAYLDGPGGTQAPQSVIDAMAGTLRDGVSNLGGNFASSRAADETVREARSAMADFFNCDPGEVAFGQNMTSLTFALSRALAADWGPDDAVVLTSLDHDANFAPWMLAAQDRGAEVRVAEFDVESGGLDPAAVGALLDERVRLVAVCAAANSIGTVVDIAAITDLAHSVRRQMLLMLADFDIETEAAHHEVAFGQHEIDFRYGEALKLADILVTARTTLKAVAQLNGLHCTFMPKPIAGINGSGMHTHQSLFHKATKKNAFVDPNDPYGLSQVARQFIANASLIGELTR